MQANILPLLATLTLGWGSKSLFFLKVVMLHIKLKGKMQAISLTLHTPLTSGLGLEGQILT